jgi:fructosamine-3-kinase
MTALGDAVSVALGERVTLGSSISGGSINRVHMASTASGERIVVKTNVSGPAGMFGLEAHGLDWLRVSRGPRVPTVLAVSDGDPAFIALEYIPSGERSAATDATVGRRIAALHRSGAPGFGLDRDNLLATIAQPNAKLATWHDFLVERRLLPFTKIASDAGHFPDSLQRAIGHLANQCSDLVGPEEPPSRLHGDLWSGNLLVDDTGAPVVIDPAVYGGHREIDLAMMRLFGGFGPAVFDAYGEAFPLADGVEDRVALNQVVPLLAQLILFGATYVPQLTAAVGRYVPVR